jgi:hypothetical protein
VTTRPPFTQASLRRAISAVRKSGLYVTGIRPDGTLLVSTVENTQEDVPATIAQRQDAVALQNRWGDE